MALNNTPTDIPNSSRGLKRLARISAWLLLAGVVVLVITGWGITHTGIIYQFSLGIIDRRLADFIHRSTNVPLAIFFLIHVLINIKLVTIRRESPYPGLINSILVIIGIILLGIVVYMEYLV
jgi:cytochrome b subunit of formate dehydrogenase